MTNSQFWSQINQHLSKTLQQPFAATDVCEVSGGCINSAYLLKGEKKDYFIKLNQAHLEPMFAAEFAGLEEIAATNSIKVPKPVSYGVVDNQCFIIMEGLNLSSGSQHSDKLLGQHLAECHKVEQTYYGWHLDNTIGSTEQINTQTNDWINFWQTSRLDFQLALAEQNGYSGKLIESGEKLAELINFFFIDYHPAPSLLHGDLWSGNAATCQDGTPVIFDPACYYGDRETDIAMTELFGGFGQYFYAAYNDSFPLHPDYQVRKTLYNLYHILNHLNLFGTGYLSQAQNMIDKLLSEVS